MDCFCQICFAATSSDAASYTAVHYGPHIGSCVSQTLWTDAFVDQEDISFWGVQFFSTTDTHKLNGDYVQVLPEQYTYNPATPGSKVTILSFCAFSSFPALLAGTWRRDSHLALRYVACWPGFD